MSTKLRESLWAAYKRDGDKKWLQTMLFLGLFQDVPMGKEVADAFRTFVPSENTSMRDDFICELYGKLHPEFVGEFRKSAIRDINLNFPDMTYGAIEKVVKRKFDAKKHINNLPSVRLVSLRDKLGETH